MKIPALQYCLSRSLSLSPQAWPRMSWFLPCMLWGLGFLPGILVGEPWPLLPQLQAQQRPYNLPKEPLEFSAHEPHRSNALDFLAAFNGDASLRYQRATESKFSFLFDINGYIHFANLFYWASRSQFNLGRIRLDWRMGAGIGLAYWPWEKLRKGYIALHSQVQVQILRITLSGVDLNRTRFLIGNSLEIGVRLGRKVASTGFFGGVGFQVPTDSSSVLPEGFSLPMVYAYLGISLGLTFR